MGKDFLSVVQERRTYYGISKQVTVSKTTIEEIVKQAVKHTPSAFNSQSARVVLLLGAHHDKLWDIAKEALRKIVPADQFGTTEEKINSFRNGYGTVLFLEDQAIVKGLQQQFPLYADNFPIWSQHTSAMHQFVIWTALEAEGLGASLQHYSELIEQAVRQEWNIPAEWKLIAQMPFGRPVTEPNQKEFSPLEDRIKVFS